MLTALCARVQPDRTRLQGPVATSSLVTVVSCLRARRGLDEVDPRATLRALAKSAHREPIPQWYVPSMRGSTAQHVTRLRPQRALLRMILP